jgi:hypothetical protein
MKSAIQKERMGVSAISHDSAAPPRRLFITCSPQRKVRVYQVTVSNAPQKADTPPPMCLGVRLSIAFSLGRVNDLFLRFG